MRRYKVRVISTLRRYAICLIWKGRLMKRLTIGTRASKLAMIQTRQVIERLQRHWLNLRSEERRVGKECRARGSLRHQKKDNSKPHGTVVCESVDTRLS